MYMYAQNINYDKTRNHETRLKIYNSSRATTYNYQRNYQIQQ